MPSLSQQFDAILQNTQRLVVDELTRRAAQAASEIGDLLQNTAQSSHKYHDQTGALTASIRAFIDENTKEFIRLVFAAEIDYGVFVELCRNGEYAFLLPVVEENEAAIRSILASRLRL